MSKFSIKHIIFAIGSRGLSLTGQTALAASPVIIRHSRQENVSGAEQCSTLQYLSTIRLIVYYPSTTLEFTEIEQALPADNTWEPGSVMAADARCGTALIMAGQAIAGNESTTLNGTVRARL